jgi:hypothetical protein
VFTGPELIFLKAFALFVVLVSVVDAELAELIREDGAGATGRGCRG